MCLVKCLPPAYYNRVPSVSFKPVSGMGCYSVGKDGVAGRLITLAEGVRANSAHRERGKKISIKRLSRNALYFDSNSELSLTANYQLAVQPLGILVGYLRVEPCSADDVLPANKHYVFVTDTWLSENALQSLAIE